MKDDSTFFYRLLSVLAIGIAVYIVAETAQIFLLIFAGVLLSSLLRGIAMPLRRYGLSHHWSLTFAVIFFFIFVIVIVVVAVPAAIKGGSALAERIPSALQRISSVFPEATQLGERIDSELVPRIAGIFSTALGAVISIFVIVVMGIYLAAESSSYQWGTVLLLPPRLRDPANELFTLLDEALRRWLFARLFIMAVLFILTWIGLALIRVPHSGLLAIILGLFSFVPNIGPILAAIPGLLVGLSESGTKTLWVLAVYIIVESLEGYVITPLVQQRAVRLPPALLFMSQLIFGGLFGIPGLVVATPFTVCVLVVVKKLYVNETLGESIRPL